MKKILLMLAVFALGQSSFMHIGACSQERTYAGREYRIATGSERGTYYRLGTTFLGRLGKWT
jgi:TRAP-type uncharacterized transport system substrate-binding protein